MIQEDIKKRSTLGLDFSSRIEPVKMNVLPRLLYLFYHYPRLSGLQQDLVLKHSHKDHGGLVVPNLRNTIMRYFIYWCSPEHQARWNTSPSNQVRQERTHRPQGRIFNLRGCI